MTISLIDQIFQYYRK